MLLPISWIALVASAASPGVRRVSLVIGFRFVTTTGTAGIARYPGESPRSVNLTPRLPDIRTVWSLLNTYPLTPRLAIGCNGFLSSSSSAIVCNNKV